MKARINTLYYIFAAIVTALSALAYYQSADGKILISEPEFDCEFIRDRWECSVWFEVENKTYSEKFRKVSVRAFGVASNPKYNAMKIYAEESFEIKLLKSELRSVQMKIYPTKKPQMIKVNMWK